MVLVYYLMWSVVLDSSIVLLLSTLFCIQFHPSIVLIKTLHSDLITDVCEVSIKGRKVTILGDTFNATNIVDIAQESDVLVHESSYGQKLMETAVARGHST